MNNSYETLGVNQSFTDDQIKEAYRDLAKKYHPDNYNDSPLREFADEKMREINAAYDDIMNSRRDGSKAANQSYTDPYADSKASSAKSNFADIRMLIQTKRITEADELLDGIPIGQRNGEWYFLKGSVYYSRGWLDDALNNFQSACRLEPNNAEFRAALNRMGYQQQGNMGGYNRGQYRQPMMGGGPTRGCSACDVCQGLICADCCCECMGGDFLSCC